MMIRTTARHLGALLLPTLVLLGAVGARAQDGPIKIAVVDIETIVSKSKAGMDLVEKLEAFRKSIEDELRAGVQRATDLRNQTEAATNPAEAARLKKLYDDEAIALQRKRDDKQRQGQKMQEEGLRAIERALGPIFSQVRDENGYDLILARTPGLVLMSSDRIDITQKVLDAYDASAQ